VAAVIREASGEEDYAAFGELIREYVGWCRERYRDMPWLIEMAFSYQSLDQELAKLCAAYGPPNGKTFLAVDGDQVLGCAAYRRIGPGVCEMKRMFVPARFHGQGLGRRLGEALIAQAKADGFDAMKLDTGHMMTEASAMYRTLGFVPCAPYVDYPEAMAALMMFMERPLAG
jgi:GNAT superfamily N-acetyltransferase